MASFAAGAVIGATRRSRPGNARGPLPLGGRTSKDSSHGLSFATAISTCACVGLLGFGTAAVVNSLTDSRAVLVSDYDARVEEWQSSERQTFSSSWLQVTASWNASMSQLAADMQDGVLNETHPMEVSEASERKFHDVEGDFGLMSYTPLKFEASFRFKSYHPADGSYDGAHIKPHSEAPSAVFAFSMRSRNGTTTRFSVRPLALAYDEVVRPRTPAPENKCRMEQHGHWRDRKCHVVRRLKSICLQVYHSEDGSWQLHSKKDEEPGSQESFGCDIANGWHPSMYVIDKCWGVRRDDECRSQQSEDHIVTVTVRSARDPFLRAEELTDGSLDFGLSPSAQRGYGLTMLAIGLCICLVPALRLKHECFPHSSLKRSDEEDNFDMVRHGDDETASASVGVYGQPAGL